jgi:hypothetical protein
VTPGRGGDHEPHDQEHETQPDQHRLKTKLERRVGGEHAIDQEDAVA